MTIEEQFKDYTTNAENYFVRKVYEYNITDPLEILNWYRNLYYTENNNTERGIMARAINYLFMKYKDEFR